MERRGARELSLGAGIPLAILGALLGLALFVAVYLIFGALGFAKWDGTYVLAGLAPALALSIVSGVGEELIFRGGVFRILEDSFGTLVALIVSAALFGLIHAGNPAASTFSSVAIALEAGVLLGLAYTVARNLWLPIGLHFGWNFTEGGIFGAAVSGKEIHGAMNVPLEGPELLTGGAFGPEASIVAVGVCLLLSLIFAIIAVRSGRWKPLSFRLLLD
jgi:membrane protease YdiL (CAAX protease family)